MNKKKFKVLSISHLNEDLISDYDKYQNRKFRLPEDHYCKACPLKLHFLIPTMNALDTMSIPVWSINSVINKLFSVQERAIGIFFSAHYNNFDTQLRTAYTHLF